MRQGLLLMKNHNKIAKLDFRYSCIKITFVKNG